MQYVFSIISHHHRSSSQTFERAVKRALSRDLQRLITSIRCVSADHQERLPQCPKKRLGALEGSVLGGASDVEGSYIRLDMTMVTGRASLVPPASIVVPSATTQL